MITIHKCSDETRYIENDNFLWCPVCKLPLENWTGEVIRQYQYESGDEYDDGE